MVVTSAVCTLANPEPQPKKRKTKGSYTHYSDEDRARIGKYASDNGNERARRKFKDKYCDLTESTVRNFNKRYLERLAVERRKINPLPVMEISNSERGRPPILLELDSKFISLKAVRGVVNIHVVRATAQALISSNPTSSQQLMNFNMPRSWVQSIYRRMGVTTRAGTTSRPPVPKGIYDECQRESLSDIQEKVQAHNIPRVQC